ncbi:hTAFII28-like protein conserved region-domain-containing protein [Phyllosticta citrichinensis]|uniref:HTAFII28-like protein conserved region-domain-containing protein n=1 Tax=Phyllosticta citrichinensis TaxID=1130410 RepID=A0ABR1XGK5_9PEZI
MASPPSNYNLSKKRPSLSGSLPANPSKRRKPSTGPSGLRQTSFPPESSEQRAEFSRSPSVDSSFTANTNTTRRKGKKGKGDDDVRSTTGTSVRGGKAAGSEAADKDAEEEEDDEGGEALDAVMEGQGEADEKQEAEHLRMLIDHLDPDQSDRYAKYRAVKLKKEIVRRITNQTLSQSVPQSVVTTINSYTKVFIGSLIERARTVQEEWQAASEYAPINDPRYAVIKQSQQPPAPPQQHSAPPTPHPQAPPPTAPSAPQTPGGFHNPYGYAHLHQQPYNPGPTPHQYSNVRLPGQPNSASSTPPTPGPVSSYIEKPSSPAPPPTGSGAATPTGPRAHTPNPAASQPSNAPNQPQPANANGTQSTSVTTSIDSTVSSSTDTATAKPTTNTTNNTAPPSSSSPSSPPSSDPAFPKIAPDAPLRERLSEWDRGPLTPDHLREALRRYKRDREGGAMGFLGLSLEGRERTAGRMGGRRLFR